MQLTMKCLHRQARQWTRNRRTPRQSDTSVKAHHSSAMPARRRFVVAAPRSPRSCITENNKATVAVGEVIGVKVGVANNNTKEQVLQFAMMAYVRLHRRIKE